MAMIQEKGATLDEVATVAYAHLFQAFAEPTRLAIVQHLASGAVSYTHLTLPTIYSV